MINVKKDRYVNIQLFYVTTLGVSAFLFQILIFYYSIYFFKSIDWVWDDGVVHRQFLCAGIFVVVDLIILGAICVFSSVLARKGIEKKYGRRVGRYVHYSVMNKSFGWILCCRSL